MAVSVQALSRNFTSITSELCHQPNGTTILLVRKPMTHIMSSHFTERESPVLVEWSWRAQRALNLPSQPKNPLDL